VDRPICPCFSVLFCYSLIWLNRTREQFTVHKELTWPNSSNPIAVPTRRAVKIAQFLGLTVVGVQKACTIHTCTPIAACNKKYINSTKIALDLFTSRHSNRDPKHVIDSSVLPSIECSIVQIDTVPVRLEEMKGEGGAEGLGKFRRVV
jgi:hypothetical protein